MSNEIATYAGNNVLAYTPSEYSTLAAATKEQKKMLLNAMNDAGSLNQWSKENPGAVLHVVGCFTQPGVRRSRDGKSEDMPCTNTTLVCEDGTAYLTQSEGIRRSVDSFVSAGIFEDGEVVDMKVVEKTIAGGNTIKHLVLV